MKILHIEDSPELSAMFSDVLTDAHHDFESSIDGKTGLDLVMKNSYDLIILDMCMPNYSGLDFLLDLKNTKPTEIKKVMIITSLKLDKYQTRFLTDLGVYSIQNKPLSIKNLLSQITKPPII